MKEGNRFLRLYDRFVLGRPIATLIALAVLMGACCYGMKWFRLDASGDDLVLENDDDVRYYRNLLDRYKSGDFVVITYSPPEEMFSKPSLARLKLVREELKALPRVSSVVTVLDAPLLRNKAGTIKELRQNIRTLEADDVDMARAVDEFRTSPIYQKLLVSEDLRSSAIQVNFKTDQAASTAFSRRTLLRQKKFDGTLTFQENRELEAVERYHRTQQDRERAERHEDIAAIRAVIEKYRTEAGFILGGVPMIVDDIITYIRKDLKVFGLGMVLLLVATLYVMFRRARWVFLPLLACVASVVAMMGLLGFLRLDVTVVSSNFTSLQLILTLALGVHVVGRYNELLAQEPHLHNRELVRRTVSDVFVPAFHAQLTTIVGFASLIACDIVPIVNFGWMMTAGLLVSLVMVFILLPAGMVLMRKPAPVSVEMQFGHPLTMACAKFVERHHFPALVFGGVLGVVAIVGCMKLEVENSFINYFRESTEIHRGMKFIDRNLGGTTPLDITIDFGAPVTSDTPVEAAKPKPSASKDEFDEFGFEDEEEDKSKYWFNTHKLETVEKVHDYLDALPETGKVLSLATVWKQARVLNDGKDLDDFGAAILFSALQGKDREILVEPYASIDADQVRINTRIIDSLDDLRRDALIKKIREDLGVQVGLKEGTYRLSGLMVLYNNMLQSLYNSQIKTVAWTLLPLFLMFLVLWRSVQVSLVAVIPSVIATCSVLGFMGLAGIPLDMMTITVVAVGLGIAVDNATHYLHRFRHELEVDGDYAAAMHRCHSTIGHNMIYSALPVILGFSILVFSNFVPSILFGLLVAFAMLIALTSDLNLLPSIILVFKPFGPARAAARAKAPAPKGSSSLEPAS